mmetsp:Transcript_52412/g.94093  ORF Transcript_52412/g.94093 Transcript_52412/m.94093 type:complete len:317 (-) Transcript_52412:22-972(-)
MASFGRRPNKGALGGSTSRLSGGGHRGGMSDAFRRMQEEEAEREKFAREFEEREQRELEERQRPKTTSTASSSRSGATAKMPNPQVFLEVEVRGPELLGRAGKLEASGRLEFELFADAVPKTAENFRCLCTGERGAGLHFEKSTFHRIIPGFMAQGGDITDGDGTGGKSIYGPSFADESFVRKHEKTGMLSMANSGRNTNNSQFFILFKATPHLDGKHVVFGQLLRDDRRLLRSMEERGTKSGDVKGTVVITRSGEISRAQEREKRSARGRSRRRSRSRQRSQSRERRRERSPSAKRGRTSSRSEDSSRDRKKRRR